MRIPGTPVAPAPDDVIPVEPVALVVRSPEWMPDVDLGPRAIVFLAAEPADRLPAAEATGWRTPRDRSTTEAPAEP